LFKLKPHVTSPAANKKPAFAVREAERGWQVCITWPDGEEGPAIGFVSRSDAETWIIRDAQAWLDRLASSRTASNRTPPSRQLREKL